MVLSGTALPLWRALLVATDGEVSSNDERRLTTRPDLLRNLRKDRHVEIVGVGKGLGELLLSSWDELITFTPPDSAGDQSANSFRTIRCIQPSAPRAPKPSEEYFDACPVCRTEEDRVPRDLAPIEETRRRKPDYRLRFQREVRGSERISCRRSRNQAWSRQGHRCGILSDVELIAAPPAPALKSREGRHPARPALSQAAPQSTSYVPSSSNRRRPTPPLRTAAPVRSKRDPLSCCTSNSPTAPGPLRADSSVAN